MAQWILLHACLLSTRVAALASGTGNGGEQLIGDEPAPHKTEHDSIVSVKEEDARTGKVVSRLPVRDVHNRVSYNIHMQYATADRKLWPVDYRDQEWREKYPGWEMMFWIDSDEDWLFKSEYPEFYQAYKKLGCPQHHGYGRIMRADFAIWAILHRYGGIYADLDTRPVQPIDDIVQTLKHLNVSVLVTWFNQADEIGIDKEVIVSLYKGSDWLYNSMASISKFVEAHNCSYLIEHSMEIAAKDRLVTELERLGKLNKEPGESHDMAEWAATKLQKDLHHRSNGRMDYSWSLETPVYRYLKTDIAVMLCQEPRVAKTESQIRFYSLHADAWQVDEDGSLVELSSAVDEQASLLELFSSGDDEEEPPVSIEHLLLVRGEDPPSSVDPTWRLCNSFYRNDTAMYLDAIQSTAKHSADFSVAAKSFQSAAESAATTASVAAKRVLGQQYARLHDAYLS